MYKRQEDTTFVRCSATRGGAVFVSGGDVSFSGCTFRGCEVSEAEGGGALSVGAVGSVMLRQASHLYDNYAAGSRNSIHLGGGLLRYVLPAPLGPSTPTVSPASIDRLMPRRISTMPSALDRASLAWSSIMTGAADWCAFSDEGDETVWSVMGGVPVKGIVGLTAGLDRVGLLNL